MSQFRQLTPDMAVSPQLTPSDVAAAAEQGFVLIVNNRPDGEEEGQPAGAEIAAAARAAGLGYVAIPVAGGGFGAPQVDALTEALAAADGPVLGFCRTGTRSTTLWALGQARRRPVDDVLADARRAGYDLAGLRPQLEATAAMVAPAAPGGADG